MRKILACILAMVLLASAMVMAVMPAAAYETEIPFAGEGNELTKDELSSAILPYMLGEGDLKLDDVGDASYVYAYWDGKPRTVVDQADRTVTLYRPVERIVTTFPSVTRVILVVDGLDRLVGVSSVLTKYSDKMICLQAYPELQKLSTVGMHTNPNAELVVALKPDVVFSWSGSADVLQETIGIPVITITTPSYFDEGSWESYRIAGKIIGNAEEVEELISYANEKIEEITKATSQIPKSEKPKVYFVSCCQGICQITKTWGRYAPGDLAGGINVAKEQVISSGSSIVSKEQIIDWNPDIILLHGGSKTGGWDLSIEDILADPDLQTVNAIKNESVYYTKGYMIGWDPATGLTETFYMAKIFHPEKFKDLDVEKENNEILERFYGADGLYTWLLENYDFRRWE